MQINYLIYNTNLASFYNASTLLYSCLLCIQQLSNAKQTADKRISPRIEKNKRLKGKIYFSVAIGLYGPLSGNYTKKESTAARQSSLFSGQYVTIPILEAISTLRMPSSINNVSDGIIPLSLSMNSNISLLGLVIPTS